MATKVWILVVSESGTPNERSVSVEAENWMAALRAGRARLGEEAALPQGASCAVAPDGSVTILDPGSRRRFLLRPMPERTAADATGVHPRQGEAVPKPLAPPQVPSPEPSARRVARRTVGYMMNPATRGPNVPIQGEPPVATVPRAPAPTPVVETPTVKPLYARDEDPSPESPLAYRERGYALPEGTSVQHAERALRLELEGLRKELAHLGRGKFIQLVAFDHAWTEHPLRPPVVTITWKDWRDEVEVILPEHANLVHDSGILETAATPEHLESDPRFAEVREALLDLPFVATASEALGFAVRLCHELFAIEAASGCSLDRARTELRVVAATGPGAAERRGETFPATVGLFGATLALGKPLRVAQANYDRRFDAGIDGRIGLEVRAALYVPLLSTMGCVGVLQLLNPPARTGFTAADEALASYIAARVGSLAERLPARRDEVA